MNKPLRKCTKCGKEAHTEEDLHLFTKDKNGKYGRTNLCSTCAAKKRMAWASENRVAVNKDQSQRKQKNKVKVIKLLGSSCQKCGLEYEGKNASVFDLHHLDPSEKEHRPSDVLRQSWKKIEKEISKCVLLCANCHRLEHQPEF
jgi:hypothetical protein